MWERFEKELKAKGLTQAQIERDRGWPKNRITKWKDKPQNFSVIDAAALAEAVGVSLAYLVDDSFPVMTLPGEPVTPEEDAVLSLIRGMELSAEEVARRLAPKAKAKAARKQPRSPRKHRKA